MRRIAGRLARISLPLLASLSLPAGGAAQEDVELVDQAFVQAFGTTPADHGSSLSAGRSPAAVAAIEAGKSAVSSPTDPGLRDEFVDRVAMLIGSQDGANILETLLVILKESVSEVSEEKKYWLNQLSEQNKMSERLSEYMKELSDAGQELGSMERNGRAPTSTTVPVTVRTFDPVWLDTLHETSGRERTTACDPCLATRETTLNAEQVQREQESILGLQRRLEAARVVTVARQAEIERQSVAVVHMLAEVLSAVDEERDGAIRGALRTTS